MKCRIVKWQEWVDVCADYDADPYLDFEITIDRGGGNTDTYYYIGNVPDREE